MEATQQFLNIVEVNHINKIVYEIKHRYNIGSIRAIYISFCLRKLINSKQILKKKIKINRKNYAIDFDKFIFLENDFKYL
jgi:hypothetical protein